MSRKCLKLLLVVGVLVVAAQGAENWNGDFNNDSNEGWWMWAPDSGYQTFTILPGTDASNYDGTSFAGIWNNTSLVGDENNLAVGTDWFVAAPGVEYIADFAFRQDEIDGSGWAGSTVALQFFDGSSSMIDEYYENLWDTSGYWTTYSISMTAPAETEYAQFKLTSWVGGDPGVAEVTTYLDDVFVTPEPATMLLLGLGGLAFRRRKRT